jgi:hypothetical protein
MRCYQVFHICEDHTEPLPGLTWRSMPDPGSSSDRLTKGLKRRIEAGR